MKTADAADRNSLPHLMEARENYVQSVHAIYPEVALETRIENEWIRSAGRPRFYLTCVINHDWIRVKSYNTDV